MDEKRQAQKELFEEFVEVEKRRHFKPMLHSKPGRSFNLSYEYLVFILIAFIMIAVISFSLGVEKGKSIGLKRASLKAEVRSQSIEQTEPLPKAVPNGSGKEAEDKVEESAPAKSGYTIQVASYVKKEVAEREADSLKKKGYNAFAMPSGRYYIVCVGKFSDIKKASSEKDRLRRLYSDCYIKKI